MRWRRVCDSPVGPLLLEEEEGALCALRFARMEGESADTPLLREAEAQLAAYFAGRLRAFALPLHLSGTPFQEAVWREILAIPYGETRAYGQLAAAVGNPRACRAVGMAAHVNPIAVIVPCHRVTGARGQLTGYAGGLSVKRALLRLESSGSL